MKTTTFKAWLVLLGLQAALALVIHHDFLLGRFDFAYLDIGSDTYGQHVPLAMHMARTLAAEGWTGWSFNIGLGAPTSAMVSDAFTLLSQLGGPDHVLGLRIWVYLLKTVLGGAAFFALVRQYTVRPETAVIAALAYSFCGYMTINGQWDTHATEFVFFPLLLWAMTRTLRGGSPLLLPVVVAASLLAGLFFVAVGMLALFAGAAFAALNPAPRALLKTWSLRILPLVAIGFALAAPMLLPAALQMLDSPRVGGAGALLQNLREHGLSLNEWPLVLAQIGGLFHKDIFGVGNAHKGHWNYFEGPEFFIGVTLLVLIAQLWRSGPRDATLNRRALLLGLGMVVVYFLSPLPRMAALGFAAPYFRVSTLWVSLALLLLAARAVDQAIERGLDGRLLAIGTVACALLLAVVVGTSPEGHVWIPHAWRVAGLAALGAAVLLAALRHTLPARLLPGALVALVALETALLAPPSYFQGRQVATPGARLYADLTLTALREIREHDPGIFRIEKTYHSVSLADALAQGYMGVKSYYLQSSGAVAFNLGTGLIAPATDRSRINYTNWLPHPGPRHFLHSLLGVKYVIAREVLDWPGFVLVRRARNYLIYRNDMVLPLGIVQTRQVTQEALSRPPARGTADIETWRDMAIFNAAVVQAPIAGHGEPLDLAALARDTAGGRQAWLDSRYHAPAQTLQQTGLQLDQFASNRLTGSIHPARPGLLVFSIPFSSGWTLWLDGRQTPLMRLNFGMLGAPVAAGEQRVELSFRPPGQRDGLLLGLFGLLALALVALRHRAAGAAAVRQTALP